MIRVGKAPLLRNCRVVPAPALELPVLVVLDEVMVRMSWKGERIEPQSVHHRHLQEPEVGIRRREMRKIEGERIVVQRKGRTLGERIQILQHRRQVAASEDQWRPPVSGRTAAKVRIRRSNLFQIPHWGICRLDANNCRDPDLHPSGR